MFRADLFNLSNVCIYSFVHVLRPSVDETGAFSPPAGGVRVLLSVSFIYALLMSGFSASARLMKLTRHIKENLNQSWAAASRRIQSR